MNHNETPMRLVSNGLHAQHPSAVSDFRMEFETQRTNHF